MSDGESVGNKHGKCSENKEGPAVVLVAEDVGRAEDGARVHVDAAVVLVLGAAVVLVARHAVVVRLDGQLLQAHRHAAVCQLLRADAVRERLVVGVGLEDAPRRLGRPLPADLLLRALPDVTVPQAACVAERDPGRLWSVPPQERRFLFLFVLKGGKVNRVAMFEQVYKCKRKDPSCQQ